MTSAPSAALSCGIEKPRPAGQGEPPRRVGAGIDAVEEEEMTERDIADAEWAARAVRDSIRRALLMAAAEFAMWARLVK
jgi:hypothetical protein